MDIEQINIITLAYLGDAVYELYVREFLISKGIAKVTNLQKEAVSYVSAKNQARVLELLINNSVFDYKELDVIKRGRNYKRDSHPRGTDIVTYKKSTGLEALIGYLYLKNDKTRLDEIMHAILGGIYEKNS